MPKILLAVNFGGYVQYVIFTPIMVKYDKHVGVNKTVTLISADNQVYNINAGTDEEIQKISDLIMTHDVLDFSNYNATQH